MPKIGVVAIQGDYQKHVNALHRCGLTQEEVVELRTAEDLVEIDRVIIPGGESTTVGLLLERYGLGVALKAAAAAGTPVWGTCMGMIMMAQEVEDRKQYSLELLDITVRRNAFGAQVHSFEDEVEIEGVEGSVVAVFIRAPVVTRTGGATAIGRYRDQVVAVRQGRRLGTAFHPELTDDLRMHRYFLSM